MISSNNSTNPPPSKKRQHIHSLPTIAVTTITLLLLTTLPHTTTCFQPAVVNTAATPLLPHSQFHTHTTTHTSIINPRTSCTALAAAAMNEDVVQQLARAKELLELSRAKLAAAESDPTTTPPSPPTTTLQTTTTTTTTEEDDATKRTKVTKTTNENDLITTDGELMAALSEEEDWEVRSLFDVFEDELDVSDIDRQLARRDVAGSIAAMRLRMQTEDYMKIFNKKDYFIGEP